MMIRAEVSSGRSDLASASPTKERKAGVGRAGDGLDRRFGLALRGRREGGGADGRDDLGVPRLDRLDRVAGIDRPLEGLGGEHLGDVGNLHHVEERGCPRHDVLGVRRRGRDDRVVLGRKRNDEGGHGLGERMGVASVVGDAHLSDALKASGALGGGGTLFPPTSTSTGPPSSSAAVSAGRSCRSGAPPATSARRRVAMFRSLPLHRAAWSRARPPTSP